MKEELEGNRLANLWASDFGNSYHVDNKSLDFLPSQIAFFAHIFHKNQFLPKKILELGAGTGTNLLALRCLATNSIIKGLEVNLQACESIRSKGFEVEHKSIQQWVPDERYDLVFTKGVLIHIEPSDLPKVCSKMVESSSRYILIAEYFATNSEVLDYRSTTKALFRGDFARHLIDTRSDLRLLDYGFFSRLGIFPQDDLTYFLFEKTSLSLK